jgi:hypothetical protein
MRCLCLVAWVRGIPPGPDKVTIAHQMLKKPVKAQAKHPLFARGLETPLTMRVRCVSIVYHVQLLWAKLTCAIVALYLQVTEDGLIVTIENESEQRIVMDHPIYKVGDVGHVSDFAPSTPSSLFIDSPCTQIAFVLNIEENIYFVSKRQFHTEDKTFKCHGFKTDNTEIVCIFH